MLRCYRIFTGDLIMGFLTGESAEFEPVSTLLPEHQGVLKGATNAAKKGQGGAFGQARDYYSSLLDEDNDTYNAMQRPELRRFNEQIIPDLAEQFAGMGSGGLSSSGFQNASINAGTDLSERLGAMRANLRAQGAAGLQQIGQTSLGNYSQVMQTNPGSEGFLSSVAPVVGNIAANYLLPGSGAILDAAKNTFGAPKVGGNSSPYGNRPQQSNGFNLPNRSF